jgi:lipid-A-disaccharide synthase
MTTILLSAGDASGEAHAAELVRELRKRMPEIRLVGLGGAKMEAAGVELIADQSALAIGGLFEIAGSLGRIVRVWRAMTRALREVQPELVVLIDSGGFNLPFARHVKARSKARVLYFIAPQLWAWRAGRLRKLVARTDRIVVLLPFELDFYRTRGAEVQFFGHPILDREVAAPVVPEARAQARKQFGIESPVPLLGILPGSRRNEVSRHLPLQLAAFARLREQVPGLAELEAIVGLAPSLDADWVRSLAQRTGIAGPIRFEPGNQTLLDAIDVAVVKPGTVTVELMLRERPMVVVGHVHPLTAAILRRALEVPWLSMPNLLAGEEIVTELMQADATPDRIAAALAPLFPDRSLDAAVADAPGHSKTLGPPLAEGCSADDARRAQIEALRRARTRLGLPGATARVAELVEEMLGTTGP